jgi:hypothetical protein
MKRWLIGALLLPASLPGAALADEGPVIALHAKEATTKIATICGSWAPTDLPCSDFVTAARIGVGYNVYLVAARWDDGFMGISCGIEYDARVREGVDVFGWSLCADGLEFSNRDWPASLSGNRIVWIACQDTQLGTDSSHALAGSFYVYAYSSDLFMVTPNMGLESGPELILGECSGPEVDVSWNNRGAVRFSAAGDSLGFNPCSGEGEPPPPPTPVPSDPPPPPPPPPPPADDQEAAVLLHILPKTGRTVSCADAPTGHEGIVTSAPIPPEGEVHTVYLLASPAYSGGETEGLAGISLGMDVQVPDGSPGLEVLEWVPCDVTMLANDHWPQPGAGMWAVWETCQTGELALIGYFTIEVHGSAAMYLTGYPTGKWASPVVQTISCEANEGDFAPLPSGRAGWVSLGGAVLGADADGCNPLVEPCRDLPTAIRASSWGKLKARY